MRKYIIEKFTINHGSPEVEERLQEMADRVEQIALEQNLSSLNGDDAVVLEGIYSANCGHFASQIQDKICEKWDKGEWPLPNIPRVILCKKW